MDFLKRFESEKEPTAKIFTNEDSLADIEEYSSEINKQNMELQEEIKSLYRQIGDQARFSDHDTLVSHRRKIEDRLDKIEENTKKLLQVLRVG